MMDREALLPLGIGLVLAVLVHLLAVPTVRQRIAEHESDYRLQSRQTEPEQPTPPQTTRPRLTPGMETQRSTQVRLVSFDHFQELMARESHVEQPAVQTEIEPDPAARDTPVDPTPPEAVSPDQQAPAAAQPSPPSPPQPVAEPTQPPTPRQPEVAADEPDEREPTEAVKPPAPPLPDLPVAKAKAEDADEPDLLAKPSEADADAPGAIAMDLPRPDPASDLDEPKVTPAPTPRPAEPATPPAPQPSPASPPRQAQPAAAPQPSERPQPTAALRTDFEAPPTSRIASASVQPGAVLSVEGVRIKTRRPRFSPVAAMTARPRDPVFTLHFGPDGKVKNVTKLRSTGYDNVDGPIVTSLYKWTAEGRIPDEGFTIVELRILLGVQTSPAGEDDGNTGA